jgi:hypothetical protein
MKPGVEIGLGGMLYKPYLIRIASAIEKLIAGTHSIVIA